MSDPLRLFRLMSRDSDLYKDGRQFKVEYYAECHQRGYNIHEILAVKKSGEFEEFIRQLEDKGVTSNAVNTSS